MNASPNEPIGSDRTGQAVETTVDPAVWQVRLRWLVAIGFALVPVVCTAVGSAIGQILHLGANAATLVIAAGAALSAVIGLVVMRVSPPTARQYGLRAPRRAAVAWWFAPAALTVVIALATQGIHVGGGAAATFAVLSIVVAVNEEVWFRGIVLTVLRRGGVRVAVIGSAVLFGLLHLSNLAGGEDAASAALQVVFAVLFGLVAGLLVVVTGSLWPAIAWHACWDFVNEASGAASSTGVALAGIGVSCAVMVVYAFVLWRRMPAA